MSTRPQAYDVLSGLRAESHRYAADGRRVGKRDAYQQLVAAWHQRLEQSEQLLAGQDDIPSANMLLMVRYLRHKHHRLTTDHNTLDQFVKLARIAGAQPIIGLLQSDSQCMLPNDGPLLSKSRELYHYALSTVGWAALPKSLRAKVRRRSSNAKFILSPGDIAEVVSQIFQHAPHRAQHGVTDIPVTDYVVATICLMALTAARISETLSLRIGDVRVGRNLTVIIPNGKGGKGRTVERSQGLPAVPPWMLDFLRSFLQKRLVETGGNRQVHLLTGVLFSDANGQPLDADRARKKFARYLRACGVPYSPHDFRRYLANAVRAYECPLITVINVLGQSTLETAPKSYLKTCSLIQRQQLADWLTDQMEFRLAPLMSLTQIAHSQGIAYETARRHYKSHNDTATVFTKATNTQVDLCLAIELARKRLAGVLCSTS